MEPKPTSLAAVVCAASLCGGPRRTSEFALQSQMLPIFSCAMSTAGSKTGGADRRRGLGQSLVLRAKKGAGRAGTRPCQFRPLHHPSHRNGAANPILDFFIGFGAPVRLLEVRRYFSKPLQCPL